MDGPPGASCRAILPGMQFPDVVSIPPGEFWMGREGGPPDARPRHRVWVDGIEMGVIPVTNTEYAVFLEATGHAPPPFWNDPLFQDPEQPAVGVSWFEAVAFCEWLTKATGAPFRLPTEAEWERGARGGLEDQPYPWGDQNPNRILRVILGKESLLKDRPGRVKEFLPNPYGLHDLTGLVHEWCLDWYDERYYQVAPERNPGGPPHGERRVSRGGAWRHQNPWSPVTHRSSLPPHHRYSDYGFRVVRAATIK